jgi:hypothetical protein
MSVKDFVNYFKNSPEYKEWLMDEELKTGTFNTKNGVSWLFNTRDDLTKAGFSKTTDLAISSDNAESLGAIKQFNSYVRSIKNSAVSGGPVVVRDPKTKVTTIVFSDVNYNTGINKVLDSVLGEGAAKQAFGSGLFQKGHYIGAANAGIQSVENSLVSRFAGTDIDERALLSALNVFDIIQKELIRQDKESSIIAQTIGKNRDILAKYEKTAQHFLIELQVTSENASAGGSISSLVGGVNSQKLGLRDLIKHVSTSSANAFLDTVKKNTKIKGRELALLKSSPSLKELNRLAILAAIRGERMKQETYTASNVKLGTIPGVQVDKASLVKGKQAKSKLKEDVAAAKVKVNAALKRLRASGTNKVISLITIQQLINGKLRDQIQNNMGKGKAKTILNYRTGRFADSVRVTRLARTKEDEVTAFYTYMKYPYQTFEPGFAQGQIATRDPKLLISKSIRDIAKDIVTARLKAVLV